jgi:hypothetical protein
MKVGVGLLILMGLSIVPIQQVLGAGDSAWLL